MTVIHKNVPRPLPSPRIEVFHTRHRPRQFAARLIGANGSDEMWRTSETYVHREDVNNAVASINKGRVEAYPVIDLTKKTVFKN